MSHELAVGDKIKTTRSFHIMASDGWSTGPLIPRGTTGTVIDVWGLTNGFPYSVELALDDAPRVRVHAHEITKVEEEK